MLVRRLKKEIEQVQKQNEIDEFIKLYTNPNDLYKWYSIITAPPDTVYLGYKFEILIEIRPDYPITPPIMKFKTKIFHPNVYFDVIII